MSVDGLIGDLKFKKYLSTFHDEIVYSYNHVISEGDPQERVFIEEMGFDEWVRSYEIGRMESPDVIDVMKIVVRKYGSPNGTSLVYSLYDPMLKPQYLKGFIKDNKAKDLVDVLGESVVGKTRYEISQMGPEFFLVPSGDDDDEVQEVQPQYHPDKMRITGKFAGDYFANLVNIITKNVSLLKNKQDIDDLFSNLGKSVEMIFEEALGKTSIKSKVEGRKYRIGDILMMIGNSGIVNKDEFTKNMISSVGVDVKSWMNTLPGIWKDLHKDEDEAYDKIRMSIGSHIKREGDYATVLKDVYHGKAEPKSIKSGIRKRKRKKRKRRVISRADLFDKIEIVQKCFLCGLDTCNDSACTKCNLCGSEECLKFSSARVGGRILSGAPHAGNCHIRMFNAKRESDGKFNSQCEALARKVLKVRKTKDGIQGVVIVGDGKFSPKNHSIANKKIDIVGKLMTSAGNVEYRIGSDMSSLNDIKYAEYENPLIPGIMFLIESKVIPSEMVGGPIVVRSKNIVPSEIIGGPTVRSKKTITILNLIGNGYEIFEHLRVKVIELMRTKLDLSPILGEEKISEDTIVKFLGEIKVDNLRDLIDYAIKNGVAIPTDDNLKDFNLHLRDGVLDNMTDGMYVGAEPYLLIGIVWLLTTSGVKADDDIHKMRKVLCGNPCGGRRKKRGGGGKKKR